MMTWTILVVGERVESAVQSLRAEFGDLLVWVTPPKPLYYQTLFSTENTVKYSSLVASHCNCHVFHTGSSIIFFSKKILLYILLINISL